ncbi:MBL fold metallo-hydrolase [bacterium]|nr:MAG: MBL fold metallo-hydrolase [bacterium]
MVKVDDKVEQEDFIKFLGTSGARFVMIKQLRASGGVWISLKGTNVLVDPGPGSIVRCATSRPKLDPSKLDAIILTHRHLDHSGDINVMIEAMTEGGFKRRGILFCPQDALRRDPVILKYIRGFIEKIEILKAGQEYQAGNFKFTTSPRHRHPVETYGIRFKMNQESVSILTDTAYFSGLEQFYKTQTVIIYVVLFEAKPGIEHFSLDDVKRFIQEVKPKKAIISHFGMSMLKAKPYIQAERLSQLLGIEVLAACDGMVLKFPR